MDTISDGNDGSEEADIMKNKKNTMDDEYEDFIYYMDLPVKPTVAFGASVRARFEDLSTWTESALGPGVYKPYKKTTKIISKRGMFIFCASPVAKSSTEPKKTPKEHLKPKEEKKVTKNTTTAFGSSIVKQKQRDAFATPGPGTYYREPLKRQINTYFGYKRELQPATHLFCTPANNAKCTVCHTVPVGDYWHDFEAHVDMCRSCMEDEMIALEKCGMPLFERVQRMRQVQKYKPARYCDYYHEHITTSETVGLVDRKSQHFEYVVNPAEIPSICFGSALEREVLPMRGAALTPLMRSKQCEVRDFPGPADYETQKDLGRKQFPSKKGYSAFASNCPRLMPTALYGFPPVGSYDIAKQIRGPPKAFTFSVASRKEHKQFSTPGPSTYSLQKQRPQLKVSSGFGSKHKIFPTVTIFCSIYNTCKCYKCDLTPHGDYWHNFLTSLDMCRSCMNNEVALLKLCSTNISRRIRILAELSDFKPARHCGFYHDHNGTTAAIPVMSKKILDHKIKKENYLYLYM